VYVVLSSARSITTTKSGVTITRIAVSLSTRGIASNGHFSTTTSSVDAGSDMVNNKGLTIIANYNEQHRLTCVLACNNEDQEHFDDWLQTSAVYFGL